MQAADFLLDLDGKVKSALDALGKAAEGAAPEPSVRIADLLLVALKKELEASEEAALWMTTEPDVEVKLALARQCGDEARHYRLIEARLRELGVEQARIDPLRGGYGPMFQFLASLTTSAERVAAGQFTREALALVQNQVFIDYCEAEGDAETAHLYRDIIQPDERHHHEMGRKLLGRLAASETAQALARAASARTLELAGELQEILRLKKGIARAPGC